MPNTPYPTTALQATKHIDWTDRIVLVAVLVASIGTTFSFIVVRTSKGFQVEFYVACEFFWSVWVWIVPALVLRGAGFGILVPVGESCDVGSVNLVDGYSMR